ncbi:putative feruloyl esterase B-2 [Trichoderma barbatum]
MFVPARYIFTQLAFAALGLAYADEFAAKCQSFRHSMKAYNASINLFQYVPQATQLQFPDNHPSCNRSSRLVATDLCRIALYVETSQSSGVHLEAWLPRNWSRRILSTGNGGLSGCIQYEDVNYGISLGFATIGTNNGHNGTSALAFLNNPEAIAEDFYPHNYTTSYYIGCSTGGRQGFQAAQKFPTDFDGIVAGSPTLAFTELTAWAGWLGLLTGYNSTDAGFVTQDLWELIHLVILDQCDGLDGAVDEYETQAAAAANRHGIIEDPNLCHPDLEVLRCKEGVFSKCLTEDQIRRARGVFQPFLYPNGSLIFPRMQPGSELLSSINFYSGQASAYVYEWFRYAVFNNPLWDASSFTLRDLAFAQELNPSDVNTWNGDLAAFKRAGGKLLHYHGLQDHLISSENSERFYNLVVRTMGLSPRNLDSFYRFFRVSGMGHCRQGPGAWMIGQSSLGATQHDAQHNVLMRMVEWVEGNSPPNTITGVKYRNDSAENGIAFSRKHCRYPAHNKYVHRQLPSSNANAWSCEMP